MIEVFIALLGVVWYLLSRSLTSAGQPEPEPHDGSPASSMPLLESIDELSESQPEMRTMMMVSLMTMLSPMKVFGRMVTMEPEFGVMMSRPMSQVEGQMMAHVRSNPNRFA